MREKIIGLVTFILLIGLFTKGVPSFPFKVSAQNNIYFSEKLETESFESPLNQKNIFDSSPLSFFVSPTPIPQTQISKEGPVKTPTSQTPPVTFSGFCLNVPVLMYHHVQPESFAVSKKQTALSVDNLVFEEQMKSLGEKGFKTISALDLVNALLNKTQLPQKSIVITLDDGYKDAYEYAFPIFKKYNLIANLLIPPGLLGGSDFLSWEQLKDMKNSGYIYIVNHTWSHFALVLGNEEKITSEIASAREKLEQETGQTVNIVGYPYGSFNNEVIRVLQKNGVIASFSTIPGRMQCDSSLMNLTRIRIGNGPLSFYGI